MAEEFLNPKQVHAVLSAPCRKGVPQVVEPEAVDASVLQCGLEGPAQLMNINRKACFIAENEVVA